MKQGWLPVLLLLCVTLEMMTVRQSAHSAPPRKVEIQRLIELLGSGDFTEREASGKRLRRIGEPALEPLRVAATTSGDPEIQRRAALLADAIEDSLSYFFNGRNLAGWRGLAGHWSVKKGDLIGSTLSDQVKFNTFLCSKKKYKDFELKFQVFVTGKGWPGNSGVQIRSEIVDRDKLIVKGPQSDIGGVYWGDLHGELAGGLIKQAPKETVARVLKEREFNNYFIKCVGKHVTIKLNGATTIDDDFPQLPAQGIIAWQLHGGDMPMTVIFRKIEFRELPGKTKGSQ